MIRGAKETVKRLRQAVRRIVRASPALREERRRARRRSRQTPVLLGTIFRFLMAFYIVMLFNLPLGVAPDQAPAVIAGIMALWATMVTLFRAQQINQQLRSQPQLNLVYVYPVSNEEAFDSQNRTITAGSRWLAWDFMVFGVMAAARAHAAAPAWSAIPLFAAAQSVVSLALAWLLATWCPPKFLSRLTLGVLLGLVTVFFAFVLKYVSFANVVLNIYIHLVQFTPAGWLAWGGNQVVTNGSTPGWLLLALAPALGFVAIKARQARRAAFRLETVFGYDDQAAAAVDEPPAATTPLTPPPALLTPELFEHMKSALRQKLTAPPAARIFSSGILEHLLARGISLREQFLLETMQPASFDRLRRCVLASAVLAVTLFMSRLPQFSGSNYQGAELIGYIAAAVVALPVFFETWLGFRKVNIYQVFLPIYSFYPVGIAELAQLYLKIGALRGVVLFPWLLLAIRLAAPLDSISWATVCLWSAKTIYVATLAQAGIFLLAVSSSTNDSQKLSWSAWIIAGGLIGGSLLFVGLAVGLFVVSTIAHTVILAVLLALLALGELVVYVFFYNGPYFDLTSRQQ